MTMQECAQCGDVLPRDGSYCGACGTPAPRRRPPPDEPASAPVRRPRQWLGTVGWAAPVLVGAAVGGALWAWPQNDTPPLGTRDAPQRAALAPPARAMPPAAPAAPTSPAPTLAMAIGTQPPAALTAARPPGVTSASAPPQASATASGPSPIAASATADHPAAAPPGGETGADAGLTPAQAVAFAAAWFDAGAAASDALGMRGFYADSVDYYQRGRLGWDAIARDKQAYLARWPQRRYQLQSVQLLDGAEALAGASGAVHAALRFSWQVTRDDGHYRRGQATTLLTLQRQDGRIRIVAERAGR